MKKEDVFHSYREYIIPTYKRKPFIFVKGKGMFLWDIHHNKFLDFFPGWGVSNLGHCHPKVMSAVRDQVSKLIHLPNNLYHPLQAKLAKELCFWAFKGKAFFCNSGAEAVEAAIKLARVWGKGRFEIITMKNSFHGRTLAALAATGQEKYRQGFSPLPEGFKIATFNDLNSVREKITDKTVAVMLELIQGEGGINIATPEFIRGLHSLSQKKNILLIFDEVQTGMGRTGKMFSYKHYGIKPDILILAKALGGGLPIGAILAKENVAEAFGPGAHASTFGGSPLVCKAALAVFKAIQKEKLLSNATKMGEYLSLKLNKLKKRYPIIKEVRGMGLMWGIELFKDAEQIVDLCLEKGLIINCTQTKILRLMPALIVTKHQIDKAITILEEVLNKIKE